MGGAARNATRERAPTLPTTVPRPHEEVGHGECEVRHAHPRQRRLQPRRQAHRHVRDARPTLRGQAARAQVHGQASDWLDLRRLPGPVREDHQAQLARDHHPPRRARELQPAHRVRGQRRLRHMAGLLGAPQAARGRRHALTLPHHPAVHRDAVGPVLEDRGALHARALADGTVRHQGRPSSPRARRARSAWRDTPPREGDRQARRLRDEPPQHQASEGVLLRQGQTQAAAVDQGRQDGRAYTLMRLGLP